MKIKVMRTFKDYHPSEGEEAGRVEFQVGEGRFLITEDFGGIRIYSPTHTLHVEPEAGNVIKVLGDKRL